MLKCRSRRRFPDHQGSALRSTRQLIVRAKTHFGRALKFREKTGANPPPEEALNRIGVSIPQPVRETEMIIRSVLLALLAIAAIPCRGGVIVDSARREIAATLGATTLSSIEFTTSGSFKDSRSQGPTVPMEMYDYAEASINSSIGPTTFSAIGSAKTDTDNTNDTGSALSKFLVDFTLDQTYAYSYSIDLATGLDFSPPDTVLTSFELATGTTVLEKEQLDSLLQDSLIKNGSGILGPGSYTLLANAETMGFGDGFGSMVASYNVTFSLTSVTNTVPEPSSLCLFGLLGGLTTLRRRRRNAV